MALGPEYVVSTRGNRPGCTHGREASLYITSGGCVFTIVYQIRTPFSLRPYSCCDVEVLALTDGDVTLALEVIVYYIISTGVT